MKLAEETLHKALGVYGKFRLGFVIDLKWKLCPLCRKTIPGSPSLASSPCPETSVFPGFSHREDAPAARSLGRMARVAPRCKLWQDMTGLHRFFLGTWASSDWLKSTLLFRCFQNSLSVVGPVLQRAATSHRRNQRVPVTQLRAAHSMCHVCVLALAASGLGY